jgi:hypothetical protein
MSTSVRVTRLVLLGALAYLGFYVFGLVMGAYGPGDVMGFTAIAALAVAGFAGYAVIDDYRSKHGGSELEPELVHELRDQRERRGY